MDIEKCQLFLSIVEHRSFSIAAEKLGYTPSGVSRAIEAWEKEAGFPLFIRGRNETIPTKEAEQLLPTIRAMARLYEQYNQEKENIKGLHTGTIVTGTSYSTYYVWLSDRIAKFHKKYPDINIVIKTGTSSELCSNVDHHTMDIAISANREGYHQSFQLEDDELVLLVPKHHPLSKRKRLPIEVLNEEPFIEFYSAGETDNSRYFHHLNYFPSPAFSTTDHTAALSMVRAGLGFYLINRKALSYLPQDVVAIPVSPARKVPIELVYSSKESISPATEIFVNFLKESL